MSESRVSDRAKHVPTPKELTAALPNSVLAFRGYNVTNLGRTPELLEHPCYGPVVQGYLDEASEICSEFTDRSIDLTDRVRRREETDLFSYGQAISLIVAVEQAQLKLLEQFHGVDYRRARVSMGFSLGEISALVAGDVFTMREALKVPLAMSEDCAALAHDVTMGVVFSRGDSIPTDRIQEVCLRINSEGRGVIGVSAYLAPNSVLVLGTQDTVARLKQHLSEVLDERIYLRENEYRWPPLHTPIVWQRNIPNRSAVMLHTLAGGFQPPRPPILSLVTGKVSYDAVNSRELIGRWIDHSQRLWDAVYELLQMGVELIVHVGPDPNIIPATFDRLASNVEAQTRGSRRMRALSVVIRRPWLQSLLPKRAALLRAPLVRQLRLEDWLLSQDVVQDKIR